MERLCNMLVENISLTVYFPVEYYICRLNAHNVKVFKKALRGRKGLHVNVKRTYRYKERQLCKYKAH